MRVLARFGIAPLVLMMSWASWAEVPIQSKEAAPSVPPITKFTAWMIDTSDAIVFGRVGAMTAGTLDGSPARFATFEVAEAIKGSLSGNIELVLPGGNESNGSFFAESVDNTVPSFVPEEEVVVFLTRVPQRERGYAISGGMVGKIVVRRSPKGEAWVAHLLDSKGGAPLSHLFEQIQKELKESGSAKHSP